ncbi:DUF262 domain-containing protein [Pseudoxanthomonas winnipegensis]|uniref:DUF262 domain-containing protein n=1 Tax=Pseudoxanthomonas winnipegensis TaxID=2480810 RepID=UPI0030F457D7
MAYVTPQSLNLKVAFSNRYSLPHYQREYKWEPRHYEELVTDIQGAFLQAFDPTHGRAQVADYPPYFLGSVITATEAGGKKPLIDGQQRLTSTFVLLAYLDRYKRAHGLDAASDLQGLIGSVSFGVRDYSIEFSDTRKKIFDLYTDEKKSSTEALDEAEEISGLDQGDQRIIEALRSSEGLLDETIHQNIAYFIDYFIERVYLIDISVAKESDAHRVFVTMNDRGLRLGPIDLLKGEILSRIVVQADVDAAHKAWSKTVNDLRDIAPEEDSLFFRNFFRAQWGNTIRGKTKGDPAGDYDNIGDAYHRWFSENTGRLGLSTADDYLKFARDIAPKFAEIYTFIRAAESQLKKGFEELYYNAARRYSFQPMVLMAAVSESDKKTDWQKKISSVSKLIDLILTTRIIEGKENNYDNLKEISFNLSKEVRGKDVAGVEAFVKAQWPAYASVLPSLEQMRYQKGDRSNILYVLARIGCYLEEAFGMTNSVGFETYWRRDKGGRTFDVEHLLKSEYDPSTLPLNHGFSDARDYSESRYMIGGLALLPRSRNRSLKDKVYTLKLNAYANENVLTQTLDNGIYGSNPKVTAFLAGHPHVKLAAISNFTKADIAVRGQNYVSLAQIIWNTP